MGCESQLATKCLFTPSLFWRAILTRKAGQAHLVFGVRSWFICRFMGARLGLTSFCLQRLRSVPAWLTSKQKDRWHFDQLKIIIVQPAELIILVYLMYLFLWHTVLQLNLHNLFLDFPTPQRFWVKETLLSSNSICFHLLQNCCGFFVRCTANLQQTEQVEFEL